MSNLLQSKSARLGSNYRPDIDGLRALAIITVVLYHAFPRLLRGGYIGVDIFFVISGYLIAKIIYQEMMKGTFSLAHFYARRVKRIFPALILISVCTFVIGWYTLPAREFISVGTDIAGGSVFLQNIILLNQSGYFDIASAKKPLVHLWSLGIEEQFYIFWPLLLLLFRRWKLNVISFVAILIMLSYVYSQIIIKKSPDMAFYLPFSRAWELLIGAALGIWVTVSHEFKITDWYNRNVNTVIEPIFHKIFRDASAKPIFTLRHDVAALLAVAMTIYGCCHFHAHTPYPSHNALIPVIAAMLLIMSSQSWFNRVCLSSRFMVAIGLISYPLYLWHYPLMAYARILMPDSVPRILMIGIVLLSVVLATITYLLLEKPIQINKSSHFATPVLLSCMMIVGALGYASNMTNGYEMRFPSSVRQYILTGGETSMHWRQGNCLLLPDQDQSSFSKICDGDKKQKQILVWGDSYAAAFYAGLNNSLKSSPTYSVAQYTASACPPILGYVHPERRFCKGINDAIIKRVAELKPDVVILHSNWSYDKGILAGLSNTITALKALHIKKIVVLGPVPTWMGSGLSENVLDYYFENKARTIIPVRSNYRSNTVWDNDQNDYLQELAHNEGVDYIAPLHTMCNQDGCLVRIGPNGSKLTAYDQGHMTMEGSTFLATNILPKLIPAGDAGKVYV